MDNSSIASTTFPRRNSFFTQLFKNFFSKQEPLTYAMQGTNFSSHQSPSPYPSSSSNRSSFSSGFKKNVKKNYFFFIPFGIIVILVLFLFIRAAKTSGPNSLGSTLGATTKAQGVLENKKIDKTLYFPLRDNAGKTVTSLKYYIDNAEIRKQIVLRGQPGYAVEGKRFLIFNLKITNDFDQKVKMETRDYLRLIVNGSSEKLAPDIHNDPLELQPIATKLSRIGFTIGDADKNLELQVGEIHGKKEIIKIQLQ